ncbi:LysR family transcriptional regulator [Paraburkholderia fungorum]|nr:LysR family transcriptional regulator [Paraburkholderia fungorum]
MSAELEMDTIQNMRIFVRVVEAGSFTQAAACLSVSTPYVSRCVQELETRLRARLMHRTTRRLTLTEVGERYLEHCLHIIARVDEAESEARTSNEAPAGKLRIRAMTGFGQHYVIKAINEYQARYPEVNVELTLGQRMPDLVDEGYDVALVAAVSLPDSALISQRIGFAFSIACASPDYIERRGMPIAPTDLNEHSCIQLDTPVFPPGVWTFEGSSGEVKVKLKAPQLKVNTTEALAAGVREGMGIGLIPIYSALNGLRSGELIWILPAYQSQRMNLYALYSSRKYVNAKIRTWIDHLRETIPKTLTADQDIARKFAVSGSALGDALISTAPNA